MNKQTANFTLKTTSLCVKRSFITVLPLVLFFFLALKQTYAGSATWNLNPASGNWNTAANWTPVTVPNGPNDIATFAISNNTAVFLLASIEVSALVFNAGASPFSITSTPNQPLIISGPGVINSSGATQHFIIAQDDSADSNGITFSHSASGGTGTVFTVMGGEDFAFGTGGTLVFRDTSTAENGTFEVFGAKPGAFRSGSIDFWDSSNAGTAIFAIHPGGNLDFANTSTLANGTITNDRGQVYFLNEASGGNGTIRNRAPFPNGGVFFNSTSAGNVTITNNGATSTSTSGYCSVSGSADTGTFINNGGTGNGAAGGVTAFTGGGANGANSTLIANGGIDGGSSGEITFSESSDGGAARVRVFGNGTLDISAHNLSGITIGSLEGDGFVSLGANPLAIGSNRLTTAFSGIIQGAGSLEKICSGTLTLTGANIYTGGTVIEGGKLIVSNMTGSGTGSGPVQVNKGRLRGRGTITGPVTLGTGGGPGAFLSPGEGRARPRTLTIQSTLTFNSNATYDFELNSKTGIASKVVANGVIISGAIFSFSEFGNSVLSPGTFFTVINNTDGTPITGTFSNLPDGSTLTIGSNSYEVNYEGGDGNDLTLTVVP